VRIYELVFIVTPEVEGEELDEVVANVTRLIERDGGSVVKLDPWGLRRLAYPIQDYREGYYFLMYAEMDPQALVEFESALVLVEPVLRYLITRPQDNVEATLEASEAATESATESAEAVEPSEPAENEAENEVEAATV
jgi:small subunit ribosomal protein S6